MGNIGPYVHQMGDAVATFSFGIAFKEFANLEEKHHEDGLWKFGVGTGKETDAQGTDGGEGHQEILVEEVASGNAFGSFFEGGVANEQIWHHIYKE